MIDKSTIDAVFETVRLEEVIGDFVQLKKSGSSFKGLSPFSDERTPSFMVSPVKQIWKDFSSGKGGNVIAFLMEHEHYTYPEAIKYLAKKYNIEIIETERTDEQKKQANEKESLFLINDFALTYFQNSLHQTTEGKSIGLSYFKERGFTGETIQDFSLGYAPEQWDAFTNAALEKGFQLEYLQKTGLTIGKEEKNFDRFKGRVMFPIQSMSGRVLGFGGRILGNHKKVAKYLNSPESEIYHKSNILYGIYQAKQSIAKEDNCFLVEGYTDVIQFYQKGIKNVVSSSGTSLTESQIRIVKRLTENITVLFDGDAAGIRASLRGIDLILAQGLNVKVCTFPQGEDPDSFARQNDKETLIDYLNSNAKDFISFKAFLLEKESENDPVKKAELVRDIVASIAKIPDVIKREVYIQECARIMNLSEEVLFNSLAQLVQHDNKYTKKNQNKKTKPYQGVALEKKEEVVVDPQFELEQKIIEILLLYGSKEEQFEDLILKENEEGELILEPELYTSKVFEKIFLDLQEDEVEFAHEEFKEIYTILIQKLQQEGSFKIENFINEMPVKIASGITDILMNDGKYPLHRWADKDIYVKQKEITIGQYVSEVILNLRRLLVNKKIDELSEQIKNPSEETDQYSIIQSLYPYISLKKLLFNKLNRVI